MVASVATCNIAMSAIAGVYTVERCACRRYRTFSATFRQLNRAGENHALELVSTHRGAIIEPASSARVIRSCCGCAETTLRTVFERGPWSSKTIRRLLFHVGVGRARSPREERSTHRTVIVHHVFLIVLLIVIRTIFVEHRPSTHQIVPQRVVCHAVYVGNGFHDLRQQPRAIGTRVEHKYQCRSHCQNSSMAVVAWIIVHANVFDTEMKLVLAGSFR